ncbi:DASH complex subunit Ask1-domain-containing protein [Lasiosphaeria ovina]|uniref:DASH complex subunit ASK1 n=1 Tax=Lasiosphaeria ovina TaxID=92902 RepID=A0AAE0K3Y1_9PEZI|nr:DASH complex subunit Ask1-domain-containing protein [Lasiosphaeria ovina]
MSRPGPSAARNLSLTEELEKLEQSITLTLQEIDHNFSKAHRIVTGSILPLVEQYGEHSRSVWDASKFWKQFFEASANVSLSGYEELANGEDSTALTAEDEETTVHDETTADYTPRPRSAGRGDETMVTDDQSSIFQERGNHRHNTGGVEDSVLTDGDGDLTGSTPRPPATKTLSVRPQFAGLDSPYETMKREYKSGARGGGGATGRATAGNTDDETDTELLFQQHTARLPDMSMTPRSSLAGGAGEDDDDTQFGQRKTHDPLLHRMLDKNYRIMATPLRGATGVSPIKWKVTEKTQQDGGKGKEKLSAWQESPMSSPEMAVPQLRSAAFMSPVRAAYRGRVGGPTAGIPNSRGAPRTPGISVQTPATGKKVKDVYGHKQESGGKKYDDEIHWNSDSEDDDAFGGMSPPKTIQFALPPSKLLQTPAREASRRIVDNILRTAGAGMDGSSEYSPTMVKMNPDILDDTF